MNLSDDVCECGREASEAIGDTLQDHERTCHAYKDEKIKRLLQYCRLLDDELGDMIVMAYVHGWRSTRHEEGRKQREKLDLSQEELKLFLSKINEEKEEKT